MPQPLQITDDLTLIWDATHVPFAQSPVQHCSVCGASPAERQGGGFLCTSCELVTNQIKEEQGMITSAAQLTASSLVMRHCADAALVKDARKLATAIATVIETAEANATARERARCLKLASAHSDSEAGQKIITAIQNAIL